MKFITLALAASLSVVPVAGFAQSMNHMGHGDSPSTKAFMGGMETMNKAMNAPMSGDADKDFAMMMIPHHQGAIDMAKVQLQFGKDPVLRKLAEDIVKAQESEIAEMRAWQAKSGK